MMRRCVILICSLLAATFLFSEEQKKPREDLFLSTPDQVATLSSEANTLVGDLISPLSGQPVLRQTDLVVKGAQNIILSRSYLPPYIPSSFPHHKHQEDHNKRYLYNHLQDNYKGWQFYPHLRLELNPHAMKVRLSEPSGTTLDFQLSGPNSATTTLASPPYALSNTSGDLVSGKYDLRNTRISYEESGSKIVVYAADGTTRIYNRKGWITETSRLYLLEKEILLNGKVLKYHHNEKNQLTSVQSLDPKERHVYATLTVAGIPWDGRCRFTSSSGLTVDYNYQKTPVGWKIKEQANGQKREQKFSGFFPPTLTSVSSPAYRHETLTYSETFLLTSYSGKDDVFTTLHAGFGEQNQHYRVHKLQLPVGQNDSLQTIYELSYHPPIAGQKEGKTVVKNSDGTSLIYHFSKNLLTTSIQYLEQDGQLKKEKNFSWDDNNWLKSLEIRDSKKNLLYKKSYEYDRFGNPVVEIFTGDLSGKGAQETFTTKRVFSQDGKNLLLEEEREDGKIVSFSYLPNTNLVTSKFTKDRNRIVLREFFIYDNCNNLIQNISDDGTNEDKNNLSGVTQRTLITYTLRQSSPFLHMPESIDTSYLENGIEKPLKKRHLVYDQHGNIASEEVYDSNQNHAYTIYKTYNERGDLLSETNRLGQQALYTYDAKGRRLTATNFSHRLQTTIQHDTKGRVKTLIEKGDDGVVHKTSSSYDFQDRKIEKKDSFGNTTHYTYDPLVSEVIKTDFPPIASLDDLATPVTTASSYDPLGREITRTDANGHTTSYRYNAYGSPIEIVYPNGGKETFRYAKNGTIRSHTDLSGVTIHYSHDILGRIVSKTYTSDEKPLAQETFTYSGFNLLAKTDKEGNPRKSLYDGAGRKIREEFSGQVTDFSYDSLSYLSTICKHNRDNTLLIHYKRDLEGRVLEERKTDSSYHTLYTTNYSYDPDGNHKTITQYINGQEATKTFVYDSFCRLVEAKDAMGHITRTLYDETHTNTLGQKVLQTATTDPHHITTIVTNDAHSRIVKQQLLTPKKAPLSCQEKIYDPQGNLLYQKDHVYEKDQFRNTQIIQYTYTPDHQIQTQTRAFGTKNPRTTSYTYLPSGKLATKTLPDTTIFTYGYHPLGFLSRLDSSDDKIHHAFDYNLLGHLIQALDENHNIAINREVDPFGNTLQERFPSGLQIKKTYDALNRLISLEIESQRKVLYTYDPLFLRAVTATSPQGDVLYSHTYDSYDTSGNLVSENLIGNLGQITHTTDLNGQHTSILTPYFSEQLQYDAKGNTITTTTNGIEHLYNYDDISQLSLDATHSYAHDSLYNRIQKNNENHQINDLNELLSSKDTTYIYDLNGNQILKQTPSEALHFTYDPLNQLVEATSQNHKIDFVYDPLERRLSKTVYTATFYGWKETTHEHYLYHGQNEIGSFTRNNQPKNLRTLGLLGQTIALELDNQTFAPILDSQGNIRRLIDPSSKSIIAAYDFTPFGELISEHHQWSAWSLLGYTAPSNPWRFASKRLDPELNLIYFGKRLYDPSQGRWLTPDPAGFVDSVNPYQYTLNNPFRYKDPDGQFIQFMIPLLVWGAEIAMPSLSAYAGYAIAGAATAAIAYGGYKAVQALNAKTDNYSPADDYAEYSMRFDAQCEEEERKKYNTNPFDGPVGGDVVVVDEAGNAIKVPQGNWLTGTKDGKWIQEMKPGAGPKGEPTGQRKDGGGHPPPKHTDIRANDPHAHVPGVTNPDGTEWLPLKKR